MDANIVITRPRSCRFVEVECLYTYRIRGVSSSCPRVHHAAPSRAANATHARRERIVHKWHSDTPGKGLRLSSCLPPARRTPQAFSRHPLGFPYLITLSPPDSLTRGCGINAAVRIDTLRDSICFGDDTLNTKCSIESEIPRTLKFTGLCSDRIVN